MDVLNFFYKADIIHWLLSFTWLCVCLCVCVLYRWISAEKYYFHIWHIVFTAEVFNDQNNLWPVLNIVIIYCWIECLNNFIISDAGPIWWALVPPRIPIFYLPWYGFWCNSKEWSVSVNESVCGFQALSDKKKRLLDGLKKINFAKPTPLIFLCCDENIF